MFLDTDGKDCVSSLFFLHLFWAGCSGGAEDTKQLRGYGEAQPSATQVVLIIASPCPLGRTIAQKSSPTSFKAFYNHGELHCHLPSFWLAGAAFMAGDWQQPGYFYYHPHCEAEEQRPIELSDLVTCSWLGQWQIGLQWGLFWEIPCF